MNMDIRVNGKYRLGRKIGSGSFGDIYLGRDMTSQKEVAIKLESKRTLSARCDDSYVMREAKIYRHLDGGSTYILLLAR